MAATLTDLLNIVNANNEKLATASGAIGKEVTEVKDLLLAAKNGDPAALDNAIARLTTQGENIDALTKGIEGISEAIREQAVTEDASGGLGFDEGGVSDVGTPDSGTPEDETFNDMNPIIP